jgi:dTDP-4-amino-4,6-dideoxygalactose transaminase
MLFNNFMKKSRVYINTDFYSYCLFFLAIFKKNLTKNFYSKLSLFLRTNNILLTSQGRVALYLIAKLLVSKKKKFFITTPYTLTEALNSIKYAGGLIKFVDINIETGLPDISQLKKEIKIYGIENSSILITHLYSSKKDILNFFNHFKKITIIEDTAINFGATINNKRLGTLSDYGFFSFGTMKNLCLFNGGLVYSKNKQDLTKMKDLENQMIEFPFLKFLKKIYLAFTIDVIYNRYIYNLFTNFVLVLVYKYNIKVILKLIYPGLFPQNLNYIPPSYNYKFNNLTSVIGLKTISKIEKDLIERRNKAKIYHKFINNKKLVKNFNFSNFKENAFLEYPVLCVNNSKNKIIKTLFNNGYDVRYKWYIDNSKFFVKKSYKNSSFLENNILCLPTNKNFKVHDITEICKIINSIKLRTN